MKRIQNATVLRAIACLFIGISLLLITDPVRSIGFCVENETPSANESVRAINVEEAVNIAREYLNIENTKNYKIKEKAITADTFNTYRVLQSDTKRLCWVVTFIVPDAVGNSRTVYVDKESGEILGGYSSK